MNHEPCQNIENVGPELHSARWSMEERDEDRWMLEHHEQVHAYSQFDAAPCRGEGCPPHIPCRYPWSCDAYTHKATTLSRLTTYESDVDRNGHIVTHRRTPTPANVLGHNADLRRQAGQVLSSVEAEMLESVLWDATDKVKRQRQNAQRGHSTHQDRRGNYHLGNQQSLTERIVNSPFGGSCSKHQYCGKLERPHAAIDEDRFSSSMSQAESLDLVVHLS